ncbi:hypothetical protein ALI144C_45010 [Actinosynnema sp. ALI-1.44]|uniref:hypothetical protein n=1 Tax=Actinosynnema sp. ALI-1.44 TaxID=1933779 RepID=UPI00097C3EF1|nr:hypothetical protein [Actinosynnema sp. ALI-1.44]ONI73113.1 hypothetical protein ALI144C_45010 [Actinosynnema sp. ALI-1.44]
MSNSDLAKKLAAIADALSEYDHLPTLGHVYVHEQTSNVTVGWALSDDLLLRHAWVKVFDVPIVLTISPDSASIAIQFELGGLPMTMRDHLHATETVEFLTQHVGEGTATLTPDQFGELASLFTASVDDRRWVAAHRRNVELSKGYGAREEDAVTWADAKTIEDHGPRPSTLTEQHADTHAAGGGPS